MKFPFPAAHQHIQHQKAGDHAKPHKGRDLAVPAEEEAIDAEGGPMPFLFQQLPVLQKPQQLRCDEQQQGGQGPEIVQRTHLPQRHLTEHRQEVPEQAEGKQKEQSVPLPGAETHRQKEGPGEHRGIDDVKYQWWQEHEHLGQSVGDQATVHLVAVGVHGFENLKEGPQRLLGQEIDPVGEIVTDVGGQNVQGQHQAENAGADQGRCPSGAVPFR